MSLRLRILIVFMLLFTVVLGTAFAVFYRVATNMAMANIRESLVISASTAANLLDGDDILYLSEEWEDAEDEYYEAEGILEMALKANPKASNAYILVPSGDNEYELYFVVDLEADYDSIEEDPYDVSDAPETLEAFNGPTADLEPVEDIYGLTLSGFAPIRDSRGKSVAIVGVEMPGEDVLAIQKQVISNSIVAFIFAYGGVFLAALLISGTVTRRLRPITAAAKLLEADQPFEPQSLEAVARGKDELGQLARVFSEMAIQVQQREQKLKQEVVQLRIQIDEAKRAQQVAEIADSDFFRDLQKKAKDMRQRKENNAD